MIDAVGKCLASVAHPRFYETERGFQGECLALLRAALPAARLPDATIVEQEYQKRLRLHGITIRPDIIVHIPTPIRGNPRAGNFAVFELNLAVGPKEARADFESLEAVLQALDYPIAIFVNIAASKTHAQLYKGRFRDRLHCFAVSLLQGRVRVKHAWFSGPRLVERSSASRPCASASRVIHPAPAGSVSRSRAAAVP